MTFSGIGRNAGIALRALHASRPDMPIVVSPMLHRMIEPFVSPELFAVLQPMTGNVPAKAFYLAHPWEHESPDVPMLTEMKRLPIYLVIDEEQRYLGVKAQ